MTTWILLGVLILLIVGLMYASIDFYINTDTDQYFVRVGKLMKLRLEADQEEILRLKLTILFFHHYFYPLRKSPFGATKKKEVKRKTRGKNFSIRKLISILKSFKVKRFVLDIDTGDCITNARLFPLFAFLNHYVASFNVNFEERNFLLIHLNNRPIDLVKSFINIK